MKSITNEQVERYRQALNRVANLERMLANANSVVWDIERECADGDGICEQDEAVEALKLRMEG